MHILFLLRDTPGERPPCLHGRASAIERQCCEMSRGSRWKNGEDFSAPENKGSDEEELYEISGSGELSDDLSSP